MADDPGPRAGGSEVAGKSCRAAAQRSNSFGYAFEITCDGCGANLACGKKAQRFRSLPLSLAIGPNSPLASSSAGVSGLAGSPTTPAAARNSGADDAVSDFLDYAKKTPAQRMRDAILKSMGLSEADLNAMSPEKRKAVEETIRQRIKDAAEQAAKKGKTGLVADVTA